MQSSTPRGRTEDNEQGKPKTKGSTRSPADDFHRLLLAERAAYPKGMGQDGQVLGLRQALGIAVQAAGIASCGLVETDEASGTALPRRTRYS